MNNSKQSPSRYFANREPEAAASVLMQKAEYWSKQLVTTNYIERCKRSWRAFNGAYFNKYQDSHQVLFSGEQGELTQLAVNHYRNIGIHLLNMTTANRPSMEAIATNSDSKSLSQAILANGLLDYYMQEKRLEEYLRIAVEYAIVLGEGYIRVEWDETGGQEYGFNEETQTIIHEGDLKFTIHSPFDVVRDSSREDQDHDWLLVRTYKNRFDLAAKYPEFRSQIMAAAPKEEAVTLLYNSLARDETDLICIYEFYHKRSEALPDGRYMIFVGPDSVLYDGALPYRVMPIFRMAPSNIIGTPYGYTPMFDLLPIQEAVNSLYSTILTNQNAFGVQNIMIPKGADLTANGLTGGLNLIEYDSGLGKPESLNLTHTPKEVFDFLQMLEHVMETISGVNSVTRGNPEASLKSGAALALVQAQAVQYASGLQQSYVRLVEDVGTAIIKILQDYATVPRVAAIIGKSNSGLMKEFTGEDLESINRIKVRIANPLAKTTAGRMEIANNLIQMGLIKNTTQYFTVLNTGNLDSMIEGDQAELLLIRAENEEMAEGNQVAVLAIDMHLQHIQEHRAVLANPELRRNPELIQLVLGHINEHIQQLKTVDPSLLQLLGQQPLPPDQGPQGAPPPGPPPPGATAQPNANEASQSNVQNIEAPLPVGVQEANDVRQPMMPKPAGNPNMPITAQAGMEQIINQR